VPAGLEPGRGRPPRPGGVAGSGWGGALPASGRALAAIVGMLAPVGAGGDVGVTFATVEAGGEGVAAGVVADAGTASALGAGAAAERQEEDA
jgi:hypothetical protein